MVLRNFYYVNSDYILFFEYISLRFMKFIINVILLVYYFKASFGEFCFMNVFCILIL